MSHLVLNDLVATTHTLLTTISGPQSTTIVVGLSGGPDSVFLLKLFDAYRQRYPITLIAAHLDHGWRTNSHEDAQFCKQLCNSLDIPFIKQHAENYTPVTKYNGSIEEVGRIMRRRFFGELAARHNALVALGHHADDQEETFILRLLRGSSLEGLCSMRPIALPYIRPLLGIKKQAIIDYLDTHAIAYRIDHTNASPLYLRNRIRNSVLPTLYASDSRFGTKCVSTITNLQEADDFMAQEAIRYTMIIFDQQGKGSCTAFAKLHPAMQKRVILNHLIDHTITIQPSAGFLQELITFITSPRGGIHHVRPPFHIHKKAGFFWFCKHTC